MKVIYDDGRGERYYNTIEEMVLDNLVARRLDFNKASQLYVKYLQDLEYMHRKQINEADMPLMMGIMPMKHLEGKPTKDAIYRYLVKHERFKGAPVWDEMVEYVKTNNINLEGSDFSDLYLPVVGDYGKQ